MAESAANSTQPLIIRRTAGRLALWGALVTLVSGVAYFLLIESAWIRTYAIPNIIGVLIGMTLAIRALRMSRSRTVIAAFSFAALIAVGFLGSIFILMRLPPPTHAWAVGQAVPNITLPNQDGLQVSLAAYRGKGPVLLVFYRGFW